MLYHEPGREHLPPAQPEEPVAGRSGRSAGWAVSFTVYLYLRYATGISWRLTFFTLVYAPEMNCLRLFTLLLIAALCMLRRTGRQQGATQ